MDYNHKTLFGAEMCGQKTKEVLFCLNTEYIIQPYGGLAEVQPKYPQSYRMGVFCGGRLCWQSL